MGNDLIFNARSARPLDHYEVTQRVPALFTDTPHPDRSDRYGMMSTYEAMSIILDNGWVPVTAAQVKPRKADNLAYGKHLIAFTNADFEGTEEGKPTLLLYNSHDGTSSFKIMTGFYRFVCSNGIVCGTGFSHNLRHSKANASSFQAMLDDVMPKFPAMLQRIQQMQEVYVDSYQTSYFAEMALDTRWESYYNACKRDEKPKGSFWTYQIANDALRAKRIEDQANTAWNIFNRVQEVVLKGRTNILSYSQRHPEGAFRKARAVTSVKATVDINQKLWDLADNILMSEAA